jgi:hypothetical protein
MLLLATSWERERGHRRAGRCPPRPNSNGERQCTFTSRATAVGKLQRLRAYNSRLLSFGACLFFTRFTFVLMKLRVRLERQRCKSK